MIDIIVEWAENNCAGFIVTLIIVLTSIVQISPIKVNPWSWIAKTIGKAVNSEVLCELETVRAELGKLKEDLDGHVAADDDRDADTHRRYILSFNKELIRHLTHTREDFIDVLDDIDFYEHYCDSHPDYKNNRAVHAIENIKRVYDERLAKGDFEL